MLSTPLNTKVQVQATTIWKNISQNLLRRRSWMHKSRFFLKDNSIFYTLKFIKQPYNYILKIRLFKKVTTIWQNLSLKFDIYLKENLNFTMIQKLKTSLQKEIVSCLLLYMILLGENYIFFYFIVLLCYFWRWKGNWQNAPLCSRAVLRTSVPWDRE